jgi:hypothetical protein
MAQVGRHAGSAAAALWGDSMITIAVPLAMSFRDS